MYSEIVNAIRSEIICELKKRVKKGDCYIFRHTEEDGEEEVYYDLSVGNHSEIGYYPDVVQVYGGEHSMVFVTVRDECGVDSELSINDIELSTADLASILDAIIDGRPVIE